MNFYLTEPWRGKTYGYDYLSQHVGYGEIYPGLIEGEYAKEIFGDLFDYMIEAKILIPQPE